MAKRLNWQEVPKTYFYHTCMGVASYGFILEPKFAFFVKMEKFYSDKGPDILDIDDVVIDDYEDLQDTGYFSKQLIYSPYLKLFQKLEHRYIYHVVMLLIITT